MEIINWDLFLMPYRQTVDECLLKFTNIRKEYLLNSQLSPIENVYGRVKRISSILDKASRKNIPFSQISQKIEDIAGIRIICRFVEDIDKILEIIRFRRDYDMRILEERDYINNRKPSGYRAYHILIKYALFTNDGIKSVSAEIQIRTMAMDFWATIEHSLNYKYNGNIPEDVKERLYHSAEAAYMLDKEMSKIRGEITEAQKIMQVKSDVVDEILSTIQRLYFVAKLEKVNDLNSQFIELYQQDDLDKLFEFKRQLQIIAELYKV